VLEIDRIERELADARELFDLSREEGDDDALMSIDADAQATRGRVEAMEFRRMFSNPMDAGSCFLKHGLRASLEIDQKAYLPAGLLRAGRNGLAARHVDRHLLCNENMLTSVHT